VDGAIGTLDYREDARLFAAAGDGQLTGIAVRQGGVVYVADVDVTPETAWTRKERKGIAAPRGTRRAYSTSKCWNASRVASPSGVGR
jgi:hypothetical protein